MPGAYFSKPTFHCHDPIIEATRKYLQRFEIIPEHERLPGRPLDPEIDLFLLYFSLPCGIRVTGQRFASHHSYPM